MVFGATSIICGLLWDISWHKTIGRDTFWTPAHLAIHLGGIVAGLTGAILILKTTFAGTAEERGTSVRIWGFRGPYGAWLAIWGAFAMITSAPFDDWWHNAYGLDVKILSPPHTILALGIFGVISGAVLLVLARQNRGESEDVWPARMFVYLSGIGIALLATTVAEYTDPNDQHGAMFYFITAGIFPLTLFQLGRAARVKWPMTKIALAYMLVFQVMNWILPLFHASPKLAPIYIPVTHMVPMPFPLLLIVPAFACDLVIRAMRERNDWLLAIPLAVVFMIVLALVQWPFSRFLLSDFADNIIFSGDHWPYFARPGSWMRDYWSLDTDHLTLRSAFIAVALAYVSTRIGLWRGKWMKQVVR